MRLIIFISIVLLLTACTNSFTSKKEAKGVVISIPAVIMERTDSAMHLINGYYYHNQQLFSGIIIERYGDNTIHNQTSYWHGKEEGIQKLFFADGSLAETRYYHLGEKDGVHTGWWQDGTIRFEYHFRNGLYDGDYKEWYSNGRPYKNIHYTNGTDDYGTGWRDNGKVFMSYVMKNGRRYGAINANLCYTLKNEQGEFVTVNKAIR